MKSKLGYWNIRGLGAPIRMLLHCCEVPFDDVRYELGDAPGFSASAWLDAKFTLGLDLPNLPYFVDDRGRFVQTLAIMRHIAARHGDALGADDPRVDMMAQAAMDLRNVFVRCCYGSRTMDDVNKEVQQAIMPQLEMWERLMSSGRVFCTGDTLTFADFFLAEHIDQMRLVLPRAIQKHAALQAYADRFFSLPQIQAFMQTPHFIRWPVNNKNAFLGSQMNG